MHACGSGGECRCDPRCRARLPPTRRSACGVSGTRCVGLRDQRSAASVDAAGRGGNRHWRHRCRIGASCFRCCWSARRCATPARCTTARWRSIAAGYSAWCRKSICPIIANSMSRGISSVGDGMVGGAITIGEHSAPFGTDLLFAADGSARVRGPRGDLRGHLGSRSRPVRQAALAGATVLANLSASNITIGKAETRRLLCASQSARCLAAYLYAAAGAGKSTTDLAWDGQASIFENGATLAETERFPAAGQSQSPISTSTCCARSACRWAGSTPTAGAIPPQFRIVGFRLDPPAGDIGVARTIERFPFVPADAAPARAGLLRGVQHPGLRPGAAAARDRASSAW